MSCSGQRPRLGNPAKGNVVPKSFQGRQSPGSVLAVGRERGEGGEGSKEWCPEMVTTFH